MEKSWNKLIDLYLNDELSEVEKVKMMQKLQTNPEMQEELELHQLAINVIQQYALRDEVIRAGKTYHLLKVTKTIGISLAILFAGVVAYYFAQDFIQQKMIEKGEKLIETPIEEEPELTLFERMESQKAFNNLTPQYFGFNGEGDVFLTESGVLLSITKESFLLNGKPYTDSVIIQWQEAVDPSDFMKAGLSSRAGNRLLETQGMFNLNAFTTDGEQLELTREGVYVQVPVDELKTGMKLFPGERQPNGDVDWKTPIELEKLPTPISMEEINLFPDKFVAKLDDLGWSQDKRKRDSLYLSFTLNEKTMEELIPRWYWNEKIQREQTNLIIQNPHYIAPSKVLAIWNKKFQNTIIGTKEFETRMQFIFDKCNNSLLDEYVNNLDKSLWEIDEMLVKRGYSTFQPFADQRIGKMNVNNLHQQNLARFYKENTEKLRSAGKQNMKTALAEDAKWRKEVNEARTDYRVQQGILQKEYRKEEYLHNLKSIYRQMGLSVGLTINDLMNVEKHSPTGTIVNIDRYVDEITTLRQTATITDEKSGKTAQLNYNEFSIRVSQQAEYAQLYMYFCPKEINSYERVDFSDYSLRYSLNSNLTYSGVIIGMNKDGYFAQTITSIKAEEMDEIELQPFTEQELDNYLNSFNQNVVTKPINLKTELNWLFKEKKNIKRQEQRLKDDFLRFQLWPTIASCWEFTGERPNNIDAEIRRDSVDVRVKRSPVLQAGYPEPFKKP